MSPAPRKTNAEPKATTRGSESSRRNAPSERRRDGSPDTLDASDPESGRPSRRPDSASAARTAPGRVLIELSELQINRVVRSATETGSLAALFGGPELADVLAQNESTLRDYAGFDNAKVSRSLLQALLILSSLPADGSHLGIADISRRAGINSSTVHRYLATWRLVGIVDRDPNTRRYGRPRPGVVVDEE